MKSRVSLVLAVVFLSSAFLVDFTSAEEEKIVVLNPRGTPPPIRLVPMAQRMDTLDGKTIYVINAGFGNTFLPEVRNVLAEKYPNTTWIFKNKGGSYFDDAPELWNEIREKGHGMIMGVGH